MKGAENAKQKPKEARSIVDKMQVNTLMHVIAMLLFTLCAPFFMHIGSKLGWVLFFTIFSLMVYLMIRSVLLRHDIMLQMERFNEKW